MKKMLSNSCQFWRYCLVLFPLLLLTGLPQAAAATANVQTAHPVRQVANRVDADSHSAVAKSKKHKSGRWKKPFSKERKKGKLTWLGILTLATFVTFFLVVLVDALASTWFYLALFSITLLLALFGLIFYKERTGLDTLAFVLVGLISTYFVLLVSHLILRDED